MIAIVDYKVGNVRSVCNAFAYLGFSAELTSDSTRLKAASGLVLPGVAAFGYAVRALGSTGELITRLVSDGKPLLGICVGYQLLFEKSSEYGPHRGLGLIKGQVLPIPPGRRIPHMGWNRVEFTKEMHLFDGLGDSGNLYFAHSYHARPTDDQTSAAYTDYGFKLLAAVQKKNIYGTQFHPEKSGRLGLRILENFASICREEPQNVD